MVEVFPSGCLSAEFLDLAMPAKAKRGWTEQTPALRIVPRSLVVYMRGTFAATCFPWYVHRETLAFPPQQSWPTDSHTRSWMDIEIGSNRC